METQEALRIMRLLSDGFDPVTGEQLPPEHLLNQGDCVRALGAAVNALERVKTKAERTKPENHGNPWTTEDDIELKQMYQDGIEVRGLAAHFSRTTGGIKERLLLLGLIERKNPLNVYP